LNKKQYIVFSLNSIVKDNSMATLSMPRIGEQAHQFEALTTTGLLKFRNSSKIRGQ